MAVSIFESGIYGGHFGDAELSAIWCDQAQVARMVQFERALAHVQGQLGIIPTAAGEAIDAGLRDVSVDFLALDMGVQSAGVPIPALIHDLRGHLPEPHGRWLHWGATSQDVLDSAQSMGVAQSLDILGVRLGQTIDALQERSTKFAGTVMAGRTRGQISTPITFGLRIANWAAPLIEIERDIETLRGACAKIQFGGASGANTAIAPHGPAISAGLAARLGLADAHPWHTDRTPVTRLSSALATLTTALAKMAGDMILLLRSEIGEISAGSGGGSSTMPQKSNPVGPEAIRTLNSLAQAANAALMQSASHDQERDGSRWPVEWACLPQVIISCGAALRHAYSLVRSLEARAERMRETIENTPGIMAEAASFALAGQMPRSQAQTIIKEVLSSGQILGQALPECSKNDMDWPRILNPDSVIDPCTKLAESVFRTRSQPKKKEVTRHSSHS